MPKTLIKKKLSDVIEGTPLDNDPTLGAINELSKKKDELEDVAKETGKKIKEKIFGSESKSDSDNELTWMDRRRKKLGI